MCGAMAGDVVVWMLKKLLTRVTEQVAYSIPVEEPRCNHKSRDRDSTGLNGEQRTWTPTAPIPPPSVPPLPPLTRLPIGFRARRETDT
jgi:hypothetical protein